MQVADGVEMLEISAVVVGRMNVIHPTLIWDEDTVILVDTGYPGQMALLREAIERAGVPWDRLAKIILTHQDLDHMGGLPAILQQSTRPVEVMASEQERPYIQGEKRPVKLTPEAVAQAVASLPAEVQEELRAAFKATLENPPHAHVDRTVADAEELPYCGGITAILTPGHTPGHISLFHRASKTLVAGDAMVVTDGQLQGPNPRATLDMAEARRSLAKLAQYDIAGVICYHGGLYRGDAARRIAELA